MIASQRHKFNSGYTDGRYRKFLQILDDRFGEPSPFRLSETPCFLPASLVADAVRAGREITQSLIADTDYTAASDHAIPVAYNTPDEPPRPLFIQADFGLDARGKLQLVEIQGFPSLYGYQLALSAAYREAYELDHSLAILPEDLDTDSYVLALREAIVGEQDPETVALLEIDPWNQKTRHDFALTASMLGIAVVDARSVVKQGSRLFYDKDGRRVPIKRIYNRVIADELERRSIKLPFAFRDELNVEWAGHPNWFFRLSKFSLPFLRHPAVPESMFLSSVREKIADPAAWVLKPLFSFAGKGVIVSPTQSDLDAIPAGERTGYLLQRRVDFTPWIETPEGATKIEIRVMYVWLRTMQAMNLIIRMGRGSQMGVDHNKAMGWVGASAAFIDPGE